MNIDVNIMFIIKLWLFWNAACKNLLDVSISFSCNVAAMKHKLIIMKSIPYMHCGTKSWKFMATYVVKYGISDKKNNAKDMDQIDL